VLLYDHTSSLDCAKEASKQLFTKKGRTIEGLLRITTINTYYQGQTCHFEDLHFIVAASRTTTLGLAITIFRLKYFI